MKKMIWIAVGLACCWLLAAHNNEPGEASFETPGGTITISYVAPHLKGRDVNELLKQPNANPWRLGADGPTRLKTPVSLRFGEHTLPAGEYTLQAWRDGSEQWFLQALDSSRNQVGSLPLEKSTSDDSADHMKITLTGGAPGATVRVQWGTHLLEGAFAIEE